MLLIAWLLCLCLGLVSATRNTRTEMVCQTAYARASPYNVASHTATTMTNAADVTVQFTTRDTTTMTLGPRMTYTRLETSVSTITETVTETQADDTFTTISTIYRIRRRYHNVTSTLALKTVNAEPYSVDIQVPAIQGFVPINGSTTSETPPPPTTQPGIHVTVHNPAVTQPPAGPLPDQTVYVVVDGKLVPTPLSAISNILSASPSSPTQRPEDTGDGEEEDYGDWGESDNALKLPIADHPASADLAGTFHRSKVLDPEHVQASGQVSAIPPTTASNNPVPQGGFIPDNYNGEEPDWEREMNLHVPKPSNGEKSHGTTIMAEAPQRSHFPGNHQHLHRARDEISSTTTIYEPRTLMGIRGVLMQSSAKLPVVYPTLVTCTKSIFVENMIWRPTTIDPTIVGEAPVTTTITTLSMLTITSTVPDRSVPSTQTFVATSTVTTTSTREVTTTEKDTLVYTITSTRTSYAACATDNVLGPTGNNNTHIVNVYTNGPKAYTVVDLGHSTDQEGCCIECHTMWRPCQGSIFTDGRCYLITGPQDTCRPEAAAGYFVSRPQEEKPAKGRTWPDYVLSNGPCGMLYDAGTGW